MRGTLGLGNANALQGSIVTDNSPAANVLTFAASGTTYNVAGLSGSGNLALQAVGGGGLTLNVSGSNNTTYSGVLSGAGGLSNGGGSLVLTNTLNSYSGPTAVNGGSLVTVNTGALPGWQAAGNISVNNGGTLVVQGGTAAGEFSWPTSPAWRPTRPSLPARPSASRSLTRRLLAFQFARRSSWPYEARARHAGDRRHE